MSLLSPSFQSANKHTPERQKILLESLQASGVQVDTFVTQTVKGTRYEPRYRWGRGAPKADPEAGDNACLTNHRSACRISINNL